MEFPYRYATTPPETPAGILAGLPINLGTIGPQVPFMERIGTVRASSTAPAKIQALIQSLGLRMRSGPVLARFFGTQTSMLMIPGEQPEPTGYEFK